MQKDKYRRYEGSFVFVREIEIIISPESKYFHSHFMLKTGFIQLQTIRNRKRRKHNNQETINYKSLYFSRKTSMEVENRVYPYRVIPIVILNRRKLNIKAKCEISQKSA